PSYLGHAPAGISCVTAGNKHEVLACWFQNGLFNYTVQVRAVNSCGQGGLRYKNFYVDYCFYYSVSLSPNPAQGTVNIELTETPFDETGKAMLQPDNRHRREYQEYSFDSHPSRIRIFDVNLAEKGYYQILTLSSGDLYIESPASISKAS